MIDDPGATPLTLPVEETEATEVFELCQVARPVTSSEDPSDLRADAVMFEAAPTFKELDPEIVTEATVTEGTVTGDGAVDESLPHAPRAAGATVTIAIRESLRAVRCI